MLKRKKRHGCGCSAHPAGSPKYSRGPCYGNCELRPAVRERKRGHRIERAMLEAACAPDDVEV